MRFPREGLDTRAILDRVLPEYKKLSDAPTSLQELEGYSAGFSAEELSQFRSSAMAAERRRRYKWADRDGNIYLSMNPWARPMEIRADGTCWVTHFKPQRVMGSAEAKRVAANATSPTSPAESGGASVNSNGNPQSPLEFAY